MAVLDIDERRLGVDLDLPLDPDETILQSPSGDLPLLSGRPNLHQAVRRRTITGEGALLFRPAYGAGVISYVEAAGNPNTRARLVNALRRNLLADPRLADASVVATPGTADDPKAAAVTLDMAITVRKDPAADNLTLVVE